MTFNYDDIPQGFYDKILDGPDNVRKFWHWHKFDSVARCLNLSPHTHLLDVGCFSGSFTGRFIQQADVATTGVDILPAQIEYASSKYASGSHQFLHIHHFADAVKRLEGRIFDYVTFIEVIEHLTEKQIHEFFTLLKAVTRPGSQIVLTTPNYMSMWPLLEILVDKFSDVTYEEQHITKFTMLNIEAKLTRIYPLFHQEYQVVMKTTSHFITPWIAGISYRAAISLSAGISPIHWHNPFGSIVILKFIRR